MTDYHGAFADGDNEAEPVLSLSLASLAARTKIVPDTSSCMAVLPASEQSAMCRTKIVDEIKPPPAR